MEKEKLEIVLEELLDEHKSLRGAVQELKQQVWQLGEKLGGIKAVAPPVDTAPVQTIVAVGLARIQQLLTEQPKTVVHERRFLLFPEHCAQEYYRVIFRLILWMTAVSAIVCLFALGKRALENGKEVKLRQLEAGHYQHAWELLYQQETKQGKKKMEVVWEKGRSTN